MDVLEIGLSLLFSVATVGALSKKIPIPLPLLQVAIGFFLSFFPGFRNLVFEPSFFFAFFIPPVLFSDGWLIPKRDFARVIRPVLLLALGLVTFTVLVVGYVIHYLIPAVSLAAAFALGAVISPTDAVAVSAMTEKLKMPNRITHIVNGESLINDASGLVAFKFAVAAVLTGAFSIRSAAYSFLVLSIGGILIGFLVAWIIGAVRVWLVKGRFSEPTIETILSLLTPYIAYFAAEYLHFSGILAVVFAGIYAGIHDTLNLTTETRRQTWEVWNTVLFVFNGLVFILLGIQLNRVIEGISDYWWGELVSYAIILMVTVILVRMIWVFPGAYIPRWLFKGIRNREEAPELKHVFIVGWVGIRGSVTLAAALSLPVATMGGLPFPGRDLLVFLASSVIILTMIINGLSLPFLLRWLKIFGDGITEKEELEARIAVARAAILRIQQHIHPLSSPHEQAFAVQLIAFYERKIQNLNDAELNQSDIKTELKIERNLRLNALDAERRELFNLHKKKLINEESLRNIQKDIDIMESGLGAMTAHNP
ncbi:MAG: Na+/H+ antiporter [Nitrospiria bacterium]